MKKMSAVTVSLFCAMLFGVLLCFFILPQKDFSAEEKRALQTFPVPDASALRSGKFAAQLSDFFADQFPFRSGLVGVKGGAEILFGKEENDGILLGADGRLARRNFDMLSLGRGTVPDVDFFDPETVDAACDGILYASEHLNCPFAVLLTGRNIDVCPSAFSYPADFSDALNERIRSRLDGRVVCPDLVSLFRASGDGLYYRTDHHWTTAGAYLGYRAAMESLGRAGEILPQEVFRREEISDSFRGTLWSAGGMHWIAPDTVEIWYRGNEDAFSVVADGRELEGFYSMDRLTGSDHYAVFLDGTHDVVTIRKTGEERPLLLVLRDSFGSSLAPFLAQNYDLVLLNLSSTRTDFTDLSGLAEQYHADAVLLVYTLENLVTANKLPRLR